jgi:phosphoglycerate-specific signal transduction histidine kinase
VNRTDLTPPEWRERDARAVAELKATGTAQPFEKEYLRKDGSRVPVLIGLTAFDEKRDEGIGFVLDLTERKRSAEALSEMQMALTHATRVATMGQLTASIAHEVGQPIATAVTNARVGLRLLGAHPPDLEEARQAFRDIVKNGEQTREIIDRIRGLVKKTQSERGREHQ